MRAADGPLVGRMLAVRGIPGGIAGAVLLALVAMVRLIRDRRVAEAGALVAGGSLRAMEAILRGDVEHGAEFAKAAKFLRNRG